MNQQCTPTNGALTAMSSIMLTSREREVLSWLAKGLSNAEIASALGISAGTIKKHLERIYRKLGVGS